MKFITKLYTCSFYFECTRLTIQYLEHLLYVHMCSYVRTCKTLAVLTNSIKLSGAKCRACACNCAVLRVNTCLYVSGVAELTVGYVTNCMYRYVHTVLQSKRSNN